MSFPASPIDNQQVTINGIAYIYSTTTNSWTRASVGLPTMSITTDTFKSDGSTTSFALSITPPGPEYVTVNIDGVGQQKTAFSLNGSTINFTGVPIVGASIEVRTMTAAALSVLSGLTYDSFTGDGSTNTFTLSVTPTNKNFTLVSVDGVGQNKSLYNVSNNVVTLTSAPADESSIEVTTFGPAVTTSIPAGINTQIQYNDNGVINADTHLSFDKNTNTLIVPNISSTTQTLSTLTVSGNITVANIIANTSSISAANITALNVTGVSNLNAITNVRVSGGTSGQFIQTDGAGNLKFASGPTVGKTIAMSLIFGG